LASSQSFTKRSPRHQPLSQLGGVPTRVTSSRSLTRTNLNGELNTIQEYKSKNTRESAQILLSQIPLRQQMLWRS
jgi:hypothetical protein